MKLRHWGITQKKNTTITLRRKLEIRQIMGNFLTRENLRKKAGWFQVI
jgi:hypothetical protein